MLSPTPSVPRRYNDSLAPVAAEAKGVVAREPAHWLAAAAGGVAISLGILHFALTHPIATAAEPTIQPHDSRRIAQRGYPELELPLKRASSSHIVIELDGGVASRSAPSGVLETNKVNVLLDTGSTVAFATRNARKAFPIKTQSDNPLLAKSFSGAQGSC